MALFCCLGGGGGVRSKKKCVRKIDGTWCDLSLWMKKLEQDWVFMTPNDLGPEMGGDEY